jgi:hypothetical protein
MYSYRRLLFTFTAPALYVCLAGQTLTIGDLSTWRPIESMHLEKSGDFGVSQVDLMCPVRVIGSTYPNSIFFIYIDSRDPNHKILATAPAGDKDDVQWLLTTSSRGAELMHLELSAAASASSTETKKIWAIVEKCANRR